MIGRIRGVILDMDGTLIDSMSIWHEIDIRFFAEHGLTLPEGLSEQVNKMSMEEWAVFFVEEFGIRKTPEEVIRHIEEMAAGYYARQIPPKPGAAAFLDMLREQGIPCCVATATYRSSAEAVLRRLGMLEYLQFVLTAEDVPGGKTTPAMYRQAAQMLGTAPEETLIVEDALHCVQTAVAGGFPVAGVRDASCPAQEWAEICRLADLHGDSLEELFLPVRQYTAGVFGQNTQNCCEM